MNFYQSLFVEKTFLSQVLSGVGVITLKYLPLLIRTMTPKIIFKNLYYMCHKSVKVQKKLNILNFGNIFTRNMIKPP